MPLLIKLGAQGVDDLQRTCGLAVQLGANPNPRLLARG